jgi:hypothetical protein
MSAHRLRLFGLALWCVLAGGSALAGAPALAAAPEEPVTLEAGEVTNTTADLEGVVNPKSQATDSWYFQYNVGAGCAGGSTTPVEGPREVEAQPTKAVVLGLQPGTQYTFCLVVENSAEELTRGKAVSFTTTAVAPIVGAEAFSNVGSASATVSAQIDAEGSPTDYRVEYGVSEAYESSTPSRSIGGPEGAVGVLAQLRGLQPGLGYHFRFVAENSFGKRNGEDATFRTTAAIGASVLSLPDGRGYELVSSPVAGEVYVPTNDVSNKEDISTAEPFRAAAAGGAVAYVSDPASSDGNGAMGKGLGNNFLATRTADGWDSKNIMPTIGEDESANESIDTRYEAFTSDLSVGILHSYSQPLASIAEPNGPAKCIVLYSRTGSGYHSLFTTPKTPGFCGLPFFAGASADGSHLLFQSEAALVEGAEEDGLYETGANLYDSVGGQPHLVNVLPDGAPDRNATFGGYITGDLPDLSNVISADGSRIFWTDLNTGILYVRENEIRTIQVSAGPSTYWGASSDGRYAFYTEAEKLWRFDTHAVAGGERQELAGEQTEIVGTGAEVQGVVSVSDDGSYVYVVADGKLAPDATHRKCQEAGFGSPEEAEEAREERSGSLPAGRGCNLYLLHAGEPARLVAVLAAHDDNFQVQPAGTNFSKGGDWDPSSGQRTSEVTPDGHSLVFESTRRLTGYDNSASINEGKIEVFVYDSDTGHLSCASCDPSGAPPSVEGTTFLPVSLQRTYMPRWISEDGSRVFFDSNEPLVSQDTNNAQDVYEWEREGASACPVEAHSRLDGGCVFLLSGGDSPDSSFFVDASTNANDVFFTTRGRLVPRDENEKVDLYDARVGGGFPEVSLTCTGTGCQGVPPASPIFATPASTTFNGVGNFLVSKATIKPKPKSARCKRGFARRRGKCVRVRKRAKRASKASKGRNAR